MKKILSDNYYQYDQMVHSIVAIYNNENGPDRIKIVQSRWYAFPNNKKVDLFLNDFKMIGLFIRIIITRIAFSILFGYFWLSQT